MAKQFHSHARPRAGCISVLLVGVVFIAWLCSILWTAIDEGGVPSDAGFPAVPAPSKAGVISLECGSGGCSREMVVDVQPPHTAQSLGAEMGLTSERCGPLNLWTLRKTCTGIANAGGKEFRIYLQYSSPLSK
ncbi:hypothetical protein [Arthrobacter sp. StoSoilB20]|uniref:hypothetical protein n=1 Tax=Arthrobacter sp. StoSoilB20 TaxID=2830995 RepID=UPI001CC3FAA8|nr:hypothetical protein [Arthrobacter sp. StoSoilB20]